MYSVTKFATFNFVVYITCEEDDGQKLYSLLIDKK